MVEILADLPAAPPSTVGAAYISTNSRCILATIIPTEGATFNHYFAVIPPR
jgi:hypothetical protein